MNVFSGYFRDEANTSANFKDLFGDNRLWFCTGDIVEYDKTSERLHVIDRFKNFVKLNNAVFVSPEYLESIFIQCVLVETLWIHAQSEDDFVVAIVMLRKDLRSSVSEAEILESFRQIAKEKGLMSHEIPRAVFVERCRSWSPETEELTVSLKLNRAGLRKRYALELAVLRGKEEEIAATSTKPASVGSGASTICSVFEQIIESVLPKANWSKRLVEQGITSTTLLSINEMCKARHVGVDVADLQNKTLSELVEISSRSVVLRKEEFNFSMESALPPDVDDLAFGFTPKEGQLIESIFLTGATGFLGCFVLHHVLVSNASANVICLVRAADDQAAKSRLSEAWKFFLGEAWDDDLWRRVRCIAGDCEAYSSVVECVDLVIHCAAFVSGVFPFAALKSANVDGSLQMIRLALRCRARFVFVSSMSALSPESSGYAMTKKISELHVKAAIQR